MSYLQSDINYESSSYIELEKTGTKYRGSERKSIKRAHGMRKFNLTSLVSAGVNPIVKEMLIGHKSSLGLDNNYYKPTEQQVLQEYLKAVDLLTINDEHRLKRKVLVLEEKQSDLEMLKLAQKQQEKEYENQSLHYEMRIDQLEEERAEERKAQEAQIRQQEVQIQQMSQMLQTIMAKLNNNNSTNTKEHQQ